ncbi:MAG: DbpA RNA binding domain-containing protein, partial [Myxococcota bacterium]
VLLVPSRGRRKLERLLRSARIRFDWKPAPSASQVKKQLRKRFRRQLHEQLGAETLPSQVEIDYAKGLLDGREPAVVVARLLEIAEPSLGREPMEVGTAPLEGPRGERPRGGRPGPGSRPPSAGYVRFLLNWGERNGAAPNRVLGHFCRRGQVRSQKVGSIEIGPDETCIEIEASAADRFEALVRKRDSRDPHLRIVRADAGRGPKPRS